MKRVWIFDWDDTLLPSTWMARLEKHYGMGVGALVRPFLDSLQDQVCVLLDSVIKHGYSPFLITNSQFGWVELSASRYMPKVLDKLHELKIPIISAQTSYAAANPDKFDPKSPNMWKNAAFWDVMKDFEPVKKNEDYKSLVDSIFELDDYDSPSKRDDSVELVVMGDGILDINAAQSVNIYDWIELKTIKLTDAPDVQTLTQELSYLCKKLDNIAIIYGEYSLTMSQIFMSSGGLMIREEIEDGIVITRLPISFIPINFDLLQCVPPHPTVNLNCDSIMPTVEA
jgi:hypothetical protein